MLETDNRDARPDPSQEGPLIGEEFRCPSLFRHFRWRWFIVIWFYHRDDSLLALFSRSILSRSSI